MDWLTRHVAGRRSKWVVFGVWFFAIFVVAGPAQLVSKFSDAEENESTSFLPGDAESTKALEKSEALQGGEKAAMVIVYRREGGLTAADRRRIRSDLAELNSLDLRNTTPFGTVPPTRGARIPTSPDGTAALLTADITSDGESDTILDPVDEVRDRVSGSDDGLEVKVTGAAGFSADAIKVFESDQRHAAAGGVAARVRAADPDLPQPDLPVHPAAGRGVRRDGHARASATRSPSWASP